jgi:hypothetical protein
MHARPPQGIPYWFLDWAQLHIRPPPGKFSTSLYNQATFGNVSFLQRLKSMLRLDYTGGVEQDPEVARTLRIAIQAAEQCPADFPADCFFERFAALQAADRS